MTRAKVLVGILLSATLLTITSCITKDYSLGTSFIPSDQKVDLLTVEFDIPVQLKMADSLQTSSSGTISVGSITSPIFGTTRIGTAATMTPATDSIIWGTDPVIESAYLTLTLEEAQVLDSNQERILQNLYVHKLTVPLDSTDYYNNSITEKDYDPVPVSEGCAVYDGGESILIPLKNSFVEPLLDFTMEQLDSTEYFVNHFYGIYVACDDVEEGTFGGRINDFTTDDSYVVVTYRYTDDDGLRRSKTVSFDLGEYWSVASIKSGSSSLVTNDAQNVILCEGYSGIKPFVAAKDLKNILDKWVDENHLDKSRVLIARASFEFPFEYSGFSSDYDNYPDNLFPCRRMFYDDDRNILYYNPNTEIEDNTFNHGDINRSLFYYKPDASIYIQKLLKGKASDFDWTYDLWFMPTITYIDSSTSETYYYVDYGSYYQGILNGTKAARHPVLKVTYALVGANAN